MDLKTNMNRISVFLMSQKFGFEVRKVDLVLLYLLHLRLQIRQLLLFIIDLLLPQLQLLLLQTQLRPLLQHPHRQLPLGLVGSALPFSNFPTLGFLLILNNPFLLIQLIPLLFLQFLKFAFKYLNIIFLNFDLAI